MLLNHQSRYAGADGKAGRDLASSELPTRSVVCESNGSQERSKLKRKRQSMVLRPTANVKSIQDVDDELERLELETEVMSESIQARQQEARSA